MQSFLLKIVSDLNKEYLKDMGVNVLGDIIAILKHSKRYHEKVAREKVLATDKEISVQKANKHLKEMLLKEDTSKPVVSVNKPALTQQVVRPSPPKKLKITQPEIKEVDEEDTIEQEDVVEFKRKVIAPSRSSVVKLAANPISAPVGKTEKKTVFQRLGESNVTSTTPEIPDSTSAKSSVFRRLGGQEKEGDPPVVSIKPVIQPVLKRKIAVPISKISTVSKTLNAPLLRMDIESAAAKQSARERLGLDSAKKTIKLTTSKAEPKNNPKTIPPRVVQSAASRASPPGVKHRLGKVTSNIVVKRNNDSTTASTSSVFSRLSITKKRV